MYGYLLENKQEYEAATKIFKNNFPKINTYVEQLATLGIKKGILGPNEAKIIWNRHILNCGIISNIIPEKTNIADIGSGAGLPGIVLAIARPDTKITLIEPLQKRTKWLHEMVEKLELTNVKIFTGTAQEANKQNQFDIVTTRAVAELKKLINLTFPLLKNGGQFLGIKGKNVNKEILAAKNKIATYGGKKTTILTLGEDILETPTTVVRIIVTK